MRGVDVVGLEAQRIAQLLAQLPTRTQRLLTTVAPVAAAAASASQAPASCSPASSPSPSPLSACAESSAAADGDELPYDGG